jgi:hypothetical protein
MGKGYAEGPAADEAEAERDRIASGIPLPKATPARKAVFGSTTNDPTAHLIGWADEVDQDALFSSGAAWGLSVRLIEAE